MTFNLPETSSFADAEFIACDFIDEQLKDVTPRIRAVTYIPNESGEKLNDGEAIVLVRRVGGNADYSGRAPVDNASISLSVLARTREDSWQIISFLRHRFYELSSGGSVSDRRIASITESNGPAELAFADPSQKMVRFFFTFGIRRKVR